MATLVSHQITATPQQLNSARHDASFRHVVDGTLDGLQRDMCHKLGQSQPSGRRAIIAHYWADVIHAQNNLRKSYPQHSAVINDLNRNAATFRDKASWLAYRNTCLLDHGVELPRHSGFRMRGHARPDL